MTVLLLYYYSFNIELLLNILYNKIIVFISIGKYTLVHKIQDNCQKQSVLRAKLRRHKCVPQLSPNPNSVFIQVFFKLYDKLWQMMAVTILNIFC